MNKVDYKLVKTAWS